MLTVVPLRAETTIVWLKTFSVDYNMVCSNHETIFPDKTTFGFKSLSRGLVANDFDFGLV